MRVLVRSGFIKRMMGYAQPIIALGWEDDDLQSELEMMGAEVLVFPQVEYSVVHKHMTNKIDYIWNRNYIKSFSLSLDYRIDDVLYPKHLLKRIKQTLMRMYWRVQLNILRKYDQLMKGEEKA